MSEFIHRMDWRQLSHCFSGPCAKVNPKHPACVLHGRFRALEIPVISNPYTKIQRNRCYRLPLAHSKSSMVNEHTGADVSCSHCGAEDKNGHQSKIAHLRPTGSHDGDWLNANPTTQQLFHKRLQCCVPCLVRSFAAVLSLESLCHTRLLSVQDSVGNSVTQTCSVFY